MNHHRVPAFLLLPLGTRPAMCRAGALLRVPRFGFRTILRTKSLKFRPLYSCFLSKSTEIALRFTGK